MLVVSPSPSRKDTEIELVGLWITIQTGKVDGGALDIEGIEPWLSLSSP